MALADGAHAHHEPHLAGSQPGLVGVGDHRGVAQRSGLYGVLVGEVRADELLSLGGQFDLLAKPVADAVEMLGEGVRQMRVAPRELAQGAHQGCRADGVLVEPSVVAEPVQVVEARFEAGHTGSSALVATRLSASSR